MKIERERGEYWQKAPRGRESKGEREQGGRKKDEKMRSSRPQKARAQDDDKKFVTHHCIFRMEIPSLSSSPALLF